METPIKIYVGIVPSEVGQGRKYTTVSKDFPKASEYICKDALLGWAKRLKETWKDTNLEQAKGRIQMIDLLIDKINSL